MTKAELLELARREAAEKCSCPEGERPPLNLMLSVLDHVRGCAYRNERSAREDRMGDPEPPPHRPRGKPPGLRVVALLGLAAGLPQRFGEDLDD